MTKKKINRHHVIEEISNDFLKNKAEIEKMSDDQLAELYEELNQDSMLHYPNGNDYI